MLYGVVASLIFNFLSFTALFLLIFFFHFMTVRCFSAFCLYVIIHIYSYLGELYTPHTLGVHILDVKVVAGQVEIVIWCGGFFSSYILFPPSFLVFPCYFFCGLLYCFLLVPMVPPCFINIFISLVWFFFYIYIYKKTKN